MTEYLSLGNYPLLEYLGHLFGTPTISKTFTQLALLFYL